MYFITKGKPVDAEGNNKCMDGNLYTYTEDQWVLLEVDSPSCKLLPDECVNGQTKCIATSLYKCVLGQWKLQMVNAPTCGYIPGAECWIGYVESESPHGMFWTTIINGEVVFQQRYGPDLGHKFPLAVPPGRYNVQVTECQEWETISQAPWLRCNKPIGPFIFNFTLTEGETAICNANTGLVTIE